MLRTLAYALVVVTLALVALVVWVVRAQYPRLRAQHLAFRFLVPFGQRALGVHHPVVPGGAPAFAWEDPATLEPLRRAHDLERIVAGGANDFERWVLLMHWARDRFPHHPNPHAPDANAFDGVALLAQYREGATSAARSLPCSSRR